jgi:peptidyl-dipeptidase A
VKEPRVSTPPIDGIDTSGITDAPSLVSFLDELESAIEEVGVEMSLCHWGIYTGEPAGDLNEIEARRAAILLEPAYAEAIRGWTGRAGDPTLERRLAILGRWFDGATIACAESVYSLRNAINDRIVGFRPEIGGRAVSFAERSRILTKEADRNLRREAYLAMRALDDAVRSDLLELIARRNERAQALGAVDFASFSLQQSSIDRDGLLSLFAEIEDATRDDHRDLLERATLDLGVERLEPWDVRHAVERAVALPDEHFPKDGIVPKVESLFGSLGIDLPALGIEFVIRDIPFGGLCFGVRIPDDVRILANPKDGHRDYEVLFHEYGHAVHDKMIDQPSPVLREGVEGCFHEAMAEVFGDVASDPEWLRAETDVPPAEIEAYAARKKNAALVRLRSLAACSVFEYGLYEDPGREADGLWRTLQRRYTGVEDPSETVWASVSLLTTHPVYFQNYVLASAIAAQIADSIRARFGRFLGAREAADFLRDSCYAPGASLDWPDKVVRATGAPLSGAALLKKLTN